MKKPQKLSRRLLLIPSLVILSCLGIIFIVFNLTVQNYIASSTTDKMEEELLFHSNYKSSEKTGKGPPRQARSSIVNVDHIVLDTNNKLIYPERQRNHRNEYSLSQSIVDEYLKSPDWQGKGTIKIKLDKQVYALQKIELKGRFDGYSVIGNDENKTRYTALIYADITPIQTFIDFINGVLLLLMLLSSSLSIGIIITMVRNINRSLGKLKLSLHKIGKRESLSPPETLAYEEFNELMQSMVEMSHMLDEAEQSKVQFFQNASHELRTPLMSIQGYAEALQAGFMSKEQSLPIILKESDKMAVLVEEILYLSNLDRTSLSEERKSFSLNELLLETADAIAAECQKKDLDLRLNLPKENILILGVEQQIERVISNILSNALRYAKTEIRIHLEEMREKICLSIHNDGESIDPEHLPHIFERFYKSRGGNFGIGLAIVQELMKKHGGEVLAQSNNEETIFTLIFPKTK